MPLSKKELNVREACGGSEWLAVAFPLNGGRGDDGVVDGGVVAADKGRGVEAADEAADMESGVVPVLLLFPEEALLPPTLTSPLWRRSVKEYT